MLYTITTHYKRHGGSMWRPSSLVVSWLLMWSLTSSPAYAQLPEDADFYRVSVPVGGTGKEAQAASFQEALEWMVRRITGVEDVATVAGWDQIKENPLRYASGRRYLERPLSELSLYEKLKVPEYIAWLSRIRRDRQTDESQPEVNSFDLGDRDLGEVKDDTVSDIEPLDERAIKVSILEIVFDKIALERLMDTHSWSRWPANRPKTALWILERKGFREDLITDEFQSQRVIDATRWNKYQSSLKYLSDYYGITFELPDTRWVDERRDLLYDIKALRYDNLVRTLAREGFSELLLVRIRREAGSQLATLTRINLMQANDFQLEKWESYGSALEVVLSDGFRVYYHKLATDYLQDAQSMLEFRLYLQIDGIRLLDDYIRVSNYLEKMPQIVQVDTWRVSSGRLEFVLTVSGVWSDILRSLSGATAFKVNHFELASAVASARTDPVDAGSSPKLGSRPTDPEIGPTRGRSSIAVNASKSWYGWIPRNPPAVQYYLMANYNRQP